MTQLNDHGFVVIGRNEGDRLKRCLNSLPDGTPIVYVDSGSTDGSVKWAMERGLKCVQLDTRLGFTAARARNAGFQRLKELPSASDLTYIQFLDGDCEMAQDWPQRAIEFLKGQSDVCAVFGRRRERHPSSSVYNRLCDIEWDVPIGQSRAFGGDVMLRVDALNSVGGYRDDLIAGEEPELSVRLRARGWRIWRLDAEMTLHDAAMTRLGQWWQRQIRSGYAFAEGAHLHGGPPERHWVRETHRAALWGVILPIACAVLTVIAWPWGGLTWLIYPLQVLRLMLRSNRSIFERALLAFFQVLGRFPEGQGYLRFVIRRLLRQQSVTIEYK